MRNGFGELVPYVDMCAPCAAAVQAEQKRRQEEAFAPQRYFESDAAGNDLLTAGVPSVAIFKVEQHWESKKGLFARGGDLVDIVTPIGRGWILGEFKWKFRPPHSDGGEGIGNFLTALIDGEREKLRFYGLHVTNGLVPVEPYSGGYKLVPVSLWYGSFVGNPSGGEGWKDAMQAVKRLAGLPTP
jgi:hypothetical protein